MNESKLTIPELCLVVLVGASGSGKSSFARRFFLPTEVLSSDYCRGLVSNDENDQAATGDAFAVLHYIAGKRLARGLLTVVDATNVQREARQPLVALAREHDVLPVAIVLDTPAATCALRNRDRPERDFGDHVIRGQIAQLRRSWRSFEREGFRYVHTLRPEQLADGNLTIERQPLWNNRRFDHGPFDVIGDVHGCYDELVELLERLGYRVTAPAAGAASAAGAAGAAGADDAGGVVVTPPPGRKAVFVGDLVDRGPGVVQVLRLVMAMVAAGDALCVAGNHDVKLLRQLRGKQVQITHGLAETLEQLAGQPPEFLQQVQQFLDGLVSHYVLADGRLAVAHAGLKESYIGRASGRVRSFALYGDTTGESDEFGLPVRYPWAAEYRGRTAVIYGHTPVPEAEWLNGTINIDTGCVFGGKLTALRHPEGELVAVPARRTYVEAVRPFLPAGTAAAPALSSQQEQDDLLDLGDVSGKRVVETRLHRLVTIREENAAAALEMMSRFAANPRWLVYLPPTMSPTETSAMPGLLEHPREAFDYFRNQGVGKVVCEEKHMGSRAVVVVCRDEEVARRRFGVTRDGAGIIYTRTGRRFFDDRTAAPAAPPVAGSPAAAPPAAGSGTLEAQLLETVRQAAGAAGLWEELASDWLCLDCELMPWSAKAQELLRGQYAALGAAARAAVGDSVGQLAMGCERRGTAGADGLPAVLERYRDRLGRVGRYVDAYRRYCWPVTSVADLKLAPFHLLASEGKVHVGQDHLWHMATLARLAAAAPGTPLLATAWRVVDVTEPAEIEAGCAWWEELTGAGGEGMVVKPLDFVVRGRRGLVQPAVKCRGPEYLRIIYGPEYDVPRNLERLRRRGLTAKRSLALRQFALGIEGLERFVRREPLRRVHECVFGVLAVESEPVDPRL
jgi:protein phosphatase